MIHTSSLTDFSVSPWTKAPASHDAYFTNERLRFNAEPILNFLADTLFSLGKPFVYRSQFTLLNVTNGIAQLSCGVGRQPHKRLRLMNGLHFTFSFTSNWQYSQYVMPKFRFPVGPDTTFWGYTLRHSSNFMTIEIPRNVLKAAHITTLNTREMLWIYHLVGAFTKNFVYRNTFYTEFNKPFNVEPVPYSITYTPIPMLFKFHNYSRWIYSFHAWRTISNTLSARSVNEQFCLHYIQFLTSFYKRFKTENVLQIENAIESVLKLMVARNDPRLEQIMPNTFEIADDYVFALLGVKNENSNRR